MKKSLRFDFYIILGIIFLSIPIILYFNVRPLISALYLFVLPTAYLFLRKKKPLKRVLAGTLLIGGGFGLIFNIIASANNAWNEVGSQLVFNYRIFGFLPTDEPIWFILFFLFVIVFYEHFYEKERSSKLSKKFEYVLIPTIITLAVTIFVAIIDKTRLIFPYAYFITALPALIPVSYVIKNRPNLIIKFLKTSIFFFMICLIYELLAIKLGQWYFAGQYVGWVELNGIRFPFEELFFWMSLCSFVTLSIYEGYVDDDK